MHRAASLMDTAPEVIETGGLRHSEDLENKGLDLISYIKVEEHPIDMDDFNIKNELEEVHIKEVGEYFNDNDNSYTRDSVAPLKSYKKEKIHSCTICSKNLKHRGNFLSHMITR